MLRHNKRLFDHLLTLQGRCEDAQRRYLARAVRSTAEILSHREVTQSRTELSRIQTDPIAEATSPDNDYLGIREVDDFAFVHGEYGYEQKKVQTDQLKEKYKPLLDLQKVPSTGKVKNTWFGKVRLDSENLPKYHGEFEKRDDSIIEAPNVSKIVKHISQYQVKVKGESIVDKEFEWNMDERKSALPQINEEIEIVEAKTPSQSLMNSRIRFRYAKEFADSLKPNREWKNWKEIKLKKQNEKQADWIAHEISKRENEPVKGAPKLEDDLDDPHVLSEKMTQVKLEPVGEKDDDFYPKPEIVSGADYLRQIYTGKREAHFKEDYDNLQKLIKKDEVLDSKGFRILTNQVPDYSKMTNSEILELLEKQILFNEGDIVALNKPYGISVHGGSDMTGSSTSRVKGKFESMLHLNYFLPELAPRLGCEKLYTVHRLDRDTTGVLLLAKTQGKAKELSTLFGQHQIEKKYLCITKNTPDIREGIINIPIELGYIKSGSIKRERMVLCPEPMEDIRSQRRPTRTARRAITKYRVLDEAGNAALLEVFPETGIKHQIRVHLGFGLRCPVLGDHKYSNLDNMAPQKLPADILMRLKVRQQKARNVPMHLHSYICMIPQAGLHGTNVFIRAPLPYHFRKNMSSLKLRMN